MGIEPTPSAWKAEVLPLNYTRTPMPSWRRTLTQAKKKGCNPPLEPVFNTASCVTASTLNKWWWGKDSNLRRHCQQIYSLPPLTAREPHLPLLSDVEPAVGIEPTTY